jgi:hypothetical protein
VEVKVCEIFTLFLLGLWTLEGLVVFVVFLGTPIKSWIFFKGKAFVEIYWEPLIKLWRFPQYFTVSMTALKD